MTDPRDQIADLEAAIDDLSEAAARCRKTIAAAKVLIAAGFVLLGTTALQLVHPGPLALVGAITGILGGIALAGSSRSTLHEILARLGEHEMRRAALIDALPLSDVESGADA